MAAPNSIGTHTTPCPTNPNHAKAKTNGDTKIEISTELIMIVRNNAFNGAETNDAVNHITRFLQITDLEKGYNNIKLFDDGESSDDKSNLINHHDTSPFLDPYQAAKNEGIQRHHMKCNDNNSETENFIQNDAPHSGNNNQGNEGICRVDKFEVIKYSIGDNEEFMGIRTLERDSWDQTCLTEYPASTSISFVKRTKGGHCTEPSKSQKNKGKGRT
ncbi:hypothetical protein Tco_1454832 [Tanacetum coccineum]